MFLEVLGSPQLHSANKSHILAAKRPFLLLSYLTYRQEEVTRDEVLALFWPEKSEQDARHSLRQLIYKSKKELYGEALVITTDKLSVDILSDVAEFQAALEIEDWAKALELYKGDFLEGIHKDSSATVEQWLTLTRHDLKNSWHYAVLKRSAELSAKEDYDASILNLEKALEKDELSEEFLQRLLRTQMQAGKFQEARQSYEKFCFRLEQDLDLQPSEQTQELFENIKLLEQESIQATTQLNSEVASATVSKQDHNLDLNEYLKEIPQSQLQQPTHSLPESTYNSYSNTSALTPFVGRLEELAKLDSFISAPEQILTITGAGGMGKTRLAEQFLIEQAHNFRHGSMDVSLTSIWLVGTTSEAKAHTIEAIATAIAYALDLKLSGSDTVKEQVLTALKDKEMLILLDNFEQLQQVGSFVVELANAAPQSKIIVTSRVTLRLAGEMVYDLQGLAMPDMPKANTLATDSLSSKIFSPKPNPLKATDTETLTKIEHYDAIALFLASSRRMNKPLVLDVDTLHFLISISQLLEGIPLAIELAATWLRLLSLEQLHIELSKDYSLLSNVSASANYQKQRHHSLKTVFDFSWSLLSPSQQTVLAKLAVFQSPFSLEAAQSVTGSSLIDLLMLVNSSLVQQAEPDYLRIHKFTQEYLQLKLQEMPSSKEETEEAYKQYYVSLLAELRDGFHNHKEEATLEFIEKSTNNVNVVWDQVCQAKDYIAINEILYSVSFYFSKKEIYKGGYDSLSQAYTSLSELVSNTKHDLSDSANQEWLSLKTSPIARVLAKLLIYRSAMLMGLRNRDETATLTEKGLRLEKLTRLYLQGDADYLTSEMALGNNILAILNSRSGDFDAALTYLNNALEIYQKLKDTSGIANSYHNIGDFNCRLGKFAEAEESTLKSIDLKKKLGHAAGLGISLGLLGLIARLQNKFSVANDYYQQSLKLSIQTNDLASQLSTLNSLGANAYHQENYIDAEKYWLRALALQQANEIRPSMYVFLNLGLVGAKNQDIDKAVSFFLKACDMNMSDYDRIQLVLFIGTAFLDDWQQEDKAAILIEQVLRSPAASAHNQKRAQEKFDQLSESARSKALSKERDFQEVFEQMVEDLSAMQQEILIPK